MKKENRLVYLQNVPSPPEFTGVGELVPESSVTKDQLAALKSELQGASSRDAANALKERYAKGNVGAHPMDRTDSEGEYVPGKVYRGLGPEEREEREITHNWAEASEEGPKIYVRDHVDVLFVQSFLDKENFELGDVDGIWGGKTEKALKAFQNKYNELVAAGTISGKKITADGQFGPKTMEAMLKYATYSEEREAARKRPKKSPFEAAIARVADTGVTGVNLLETYKSIVTDADTNAWTVEQVGNFLITFDDVVAESVKDYEGTVHKKNPFRVKGKGIVLVGKGFDKNIVVLDKEKTNTAVADFFGGNRDTLDKFLDAWWQKEFNSEE